MKIAASGLVALLLLGSINFSCGKKSSLEAASNEPGVDSAKQEELFVWVENARIRKSPDLNGEVITEIKGGEKLVLTGEKSNTSTKVSLRGVDFEDVWVKVKTQDGIEGWIFKAMLTDNEEKAIAMNDFLIVPGETVGYVKLGATVKEVENIFGKEFITRGSIYDGEGYEWPGFYLFKNCPHELQCIVKDSDSTIDNIKIRQPGAAWKTAEGIKIGTTLDEVVKMNGKPISFDGFGGEDGGWIEGYSGGRLSSYQYNIGICFGEPDDLTGLDDFMVVGTCSTTNKLILGKGVKVAEIVVYTSVRI